MIRRSIFRFLLLFRQLQRFAARPRASGIPALGRGQCLGAGKAEARKLLENAARPPGSPTHRANALLAGAYYSRFTGCKGIAQ